MKYTIVFLMLFLVGCSAIPSKPIEVKVPVAVYCNIKEPKKPEFKVQKELIGKDIEYKVRMLLAERKQRQGYELELEEAIKSCNE